MARVGIGVPVFNGGGLLREALECLRTQTFEDIEVVIGDNASTDQTGDICAEYAARDSRFRHLRRPENIGALANFVGLLEGSGADLFMWRAHDDLSEANYIEALAACSTANLASISPSATSSANRTTGRGRASIPTGRRPADRASSRSCTSSPPAMRAGSTGCGAARRCRASRRASTTSTGILGRRPSDGAALILDGRIGGTGESSFTQRFIRAGTTRAERLARRPGIGFMRTLRAEFAAVAWAEIDKRDFSAAERAVLTAVMPSYIDRRAYPRAKLMRRAIRHRLGLAQDTLSRRPPEQETP